jgi:hypothetical protein
MSFVEFADQFRLKLVREDGEMIIPGNRGQIYVVAPGKLGCLILAKSKRHWHIVRRSLTTAGCEVLQDGDAEGTLLVNPNDAAQVRAAVTAIAAKRKRSVTAAQREALAGRLPRSPNFQRNRVVSSPS